MDGILHRLGFDPLAPDHVFHSNLGVDTGDILGPFSPGRDLNPQDSLALLFQNAEDIMGRTTGHADQDQLHGRGPQFLRTPIHYNRVSRRSLTHKTSIFHPGYFGRRSHCVSLVRSRALRASSMSSALTGSLSNQSPVASWIASRMAGASKSIGISPTPRMP